MYTKRDPIEFPQKYALSVPYCLIYDPIANMYLTSDGWISSKSRASYYLEDTAELITLKNGWLLEYCGHIARRIG